MVVGILVTVIITSQLYQIIHRLFLANQITIKGSKIKGGQFQQQRTGKLTALTVNDLLGSPDQVTSNLITSAPVPFN